MTRPSILLLFTTMMIYPSFICALLVNKNTIFPTSRLFGIQNTALFDISSSIAAVDQEINEKKDSTAWVPPSQSIEQRRGNIFSIEKPEDLLNFVIEDESLSVVKVYASWCKTCKVFDIRYRKLAQQNKGRVRFAEMKYDDANNKEMCEFLNATKLPYILIYKGSQGKVKDFQCSPSKFKLLIDAIDELAVDYDDDVSSSSIDNNGRGNSTNYEMDMSTNTTASQITTADGEDTIDSLKQQLEQETAEKVEMFEIMKAQIEYDKTYIQKLETGVETQKSMIEERDVEISKLQSIVKTKDEEIQSLTDNINQQQEQSKHDKQQLSTYKEQTEQLNNRISQIEENITSMEVESSDNKQAAEERKRELIQQIDEYEKERNSLRQLAKLGVKRVGRGVRCFIQRFRGGRGV